jgi:putative ABC transport system permease protein
MNIMLVAVAERTREIGIRKAIGANSKAIRNQFLFESVIIGQLGGLVGIILGIMVGNIMSMVMKSDFIVPWNWVILGIIVCLIVGVLSGLLPALKASKLDPIESLRYE